MSEPAPRSPWSLPAAALGMLCSLLALAGCAGRRGPGRQLLPPGAARAGYERMLDTPDSLDTAPLVGFRIALDPGHGGVFRGSLGTGGLAEAEVNLGVALRLRDRLRAAGAEVLLTRETDHDFLTPADSSLRADLAERSRVANAFAPDLFLSIHHNADAGSRHDVSETQTYWKLDDDGASFEAAADLHRALVRNVGLGADRLLPGNYAVLRQSEAPAILTEASYLTYPPSEARLRTAEAQQLEADALFVGLAHYLGRGAPRVVAFGNSDGGDDAPGAWDGGRGLRAEIAGPFDVVEMTLDGAPVTAERQGQVIGWAPRLPLAAGKHEATLRVRLAGAGSSRRARYAFDVLGLADRLQLDAPFQADWAASDEALAVRVRLLDRQGRNDPGGPPQVRVRSDARWLPADTTITLRDGEGWVYLRRSPARARPATGPVRLRAEPARSDIRRAELEVPIRPGARMIESIGFALEPSGARFSPGPPAARADAVLNADGFGRFRRFVAFGAAAAPEWTPGWRRSPLGFETASALAPGELAGASAFVSWFGGALHGRRIAVDAAGDGDTPGLPRAGRTGLSPSGTRAADVNLDVARALVEMLRVMGAEALLVRDGPVPMLDVDRVRHVERFRAERYLRIARAADAPRVVAYLGSASGRHWGAQVQAAFDSLGGRRPALSEGAEWVLQQTSCPALLAELDTLSDQRPELASVRGEAYRLLLGIAREFAPSASWPVGRIACVGADGSPAAGRTVTIGDALVLATGADGEVRFLRGEPGAIIVSAGGAHVAHRGVLLASDRLLRLRESP